MTIEDIIKANGGTVAKQSSESADTGTKSTSRISEIIAANKEAADKQLAVRNAPKAHGGASGKFGVDAKKDDGTIKIHALGAGETKPTTSRVGKTINAGVQGTMSNFTNFWGWLRSRPWRLSSRRTTPTSAGARWWWSSDPPVPASPPSSAA